MFHIPLFISGTEIAFIMFILIMVFGADKIPEIARGLGKGMRGIKNATNDIKGEVMKNADFDNDNIKGIQSQFRKQYDKTRDEITDITNPKSKN